MPITATGICSNHDLSIVTSFTKTGVPDVLRVGEIIRAVAAAEILPRYEKLERHEINEKHAGEIVTAADIASEAKLIAALTDLLPGSVVVGEEGFAADPTIIEHLSRDAAVWIIDPLDGTRNFAEGRPTFAVIIALVVRGETQAGWIYDPVADDLIWGATVASRRRPDPCRAEWSVQSPASGFRSCRPSGWR